jgi:sulfate adenylyltransferase
MGHHNLISPHGGRLVNRVIETKKSFEDMTFLDISNDLRNDIENIADGIFSPLEGFVGNDEFRKIVQHGRLCNDLAWTIPIMLDVDKKTSVNMKDAGEVLLKNNNESFGLLQVDEIYPLEKLPVSKALYNTDDLKHPGVSKISTMNDYLIGGKVDVISRIPHTPLRKFRMTPLEARSEIQKRGWETVVGFQTRNVPHIAHEMVQKAALNIYDGLFLNPLIGKKKQGDFKDELILNAYNSLINNYYPMYSTIFATLHTEMRYAGPKEAIHHAIMRKNFGCSHFIVGRDHAGVGQFYHPFAAHEIFKNYPDLEIDPIFFPEFYYCKRCVGYSNAKNCPHGLEFREVLSGTKMRKMVSSGEMPSEHLMRPEISRIILSYTDPFISTS